MQPHQDFRSFLEKSLQILKNIHFRTRKKQPKPKGFREDLRVVVPFLEAQMHERGFEDWRDLARHLGGGPTKRSSRIWDELLEFKREGYLSEATWRLLSETLGFDLAPVSQEIERQRQVFQMMGSLEADLQLKNLENLQLSRYRILSRLIARVQHLFLNFQTLVEHPDWYNASAPIHVDILFMDRIPVTLGEMVWGWMTGRYVLPASCCGPVLMTDLAGSPLSLAGSATGLCLGCLKEHVVKGLPRDLLRNYLHYRPLLPYAPSPLTVEEVLEKFNEASRLG